MYENPPYKFMKNREKKLIKSTKEEIEILISEGDSEWYKSIDFIIKTKR